MINDKFKDELSNFQCKLSFWLKHNFPTSTPDQQLKGIMEELGELCHADLKCEQGIRGYDEQKALSEIKDAVGDTVIYMINYCNKKEIDFSECLDIAYSEIMKRDWIKNNQSGKG